MPYADNEKNKAARRRYQASSKGKAGQQRRAKLPKRQAYVKKYYPKYMRNYRLEKAYGITTEQWHEIFAAQGNACAVCKTSDPGSKTGWHTDHCHKTMVVRGILCAGCNGALGQAKDDPLRLRLLAEYVECPR